MKYIHTYLYMCIYIICVYTYIWIYIFSSSQLHNYIIYYIMNIIIHHTHMYIFIYIYIWIYIPFFFSSQLHNYFPGKPFLVSPCIPISDYILSLIISELGFPILWGQFISQSSMTSISVKNMELCLLSNGIVNPFISIVYSVYHNPVEWI